MFYDPRSEPHGLAHDPFQALVAPRPIGWISTRSVDGIANLSPYSYYNAFSTRPYIVGFSSTGRKDSLANVEAIGAFAVNVASADLTTAMNESSAVVSRDVDEFALAGLTAVPCRNIDVPRVGEAHAVLECVHLQTIPLVGLEGGEAASFLVLGQVVGIHIDDMILSHGLVDTAKLRPLARLGYMDYAVVVETFSMARPPAGGRR